MIDQAIAKHAGQLQAEGQRANRYVRRIARLVGIPAFALILIGLGVESLGRQAGVDARFPGAHVVGFTSLFRPAEFSANWLMSIGLLGLCLVPVISILAILAQQMRTRRWMEAAVSLLVVGILLLSLLVGKG